MRPSAISTIARWFCADGSPGASARLRSTAAIASSGRPSS